MIKSFNSKAECSSEIKRLRLLQQQQILRPEVIPQELAKSNQWVVWSYEVSEQKQGIFRVDKQPYQPKEPHSEVSRVCTLDWSDLSTALRCVKENPHIDGIGYMFAEGDGLIGIDFDNCRTPSTGKIRTEYQFWIEKFGSYTEISPSGTGVKVWVKGTISNRYFKSTESTGFRILNFADGEIEIYRRGQYFTVTTQMINGFDSIRDAQAELDVICEFSLSKTQWNFRYSSNPDYKLTELDANRELSLLQDYWDEMSPEYIINEGDFQPNVVKVPPIDELSTDVQLQSVTKKSHFFVGRSWCRRCGREASPGKELCFYCHRIGKPEVIVEQAVYDYFLTFQGFSVARQYEINIGVYTPRPDVVLLDAKENLVAIAECKREGIMDNGIEQLKSYLSASDTQFGIFANGTEPDNWIFYENLRRHNFEDAIPRSRFEAEIQMNLPVESIREEKDRLVKETSDLYEQHKRNVSNIESSNKNLEKLKNQIVDEHQTFTKIKDDNKRFKDDSEKLEKKNTELIIKIDRNAKQLEVQESLKLLTTREKLESEIISFHEQKKQLQNEIRNKQRQSSDLSAKNKIVTNQMSEYVKKQSKIISERAKLEKDQKTWQIQQENRKTAKAELENEIKDLRGEITKKYRAIKEFEKEFSMESIYGEFEKEFERLQKIESYIARKQQLARNIQEQYAGYEINRVEIGKKIQRIIHVSQERETVLKQLRDVVNRLKTAESEQKPGIERHREQLVQDLRSQKNKYARLATEIRQLQKVQSILEPEINAKEHQSQYTVIDILPTYLQIEDEINVLKAEKYELKAEIGHKIFELIPKKIKISTLKSKENE